MGSATRTVTSPA